MSPITTVIFDMYDTLVLNDQRRWDTTFHEIVQEQELDTSPDRLWQLWIEAGQEFRSSRVRADTPFQTYHQAWRDGFARAFNTLGLSGDPEAAVDKSIRELSHRAAFPETAQALKAIQKNWRTAVLSNADDNFLLPNLEHLSLDFEVVLSSEGARSYKPNPDLFLEMLRRLGVNPEETVYVGDQQLEDVQGALGVGINAIWINRRGAALDPQLPKPACQISSLLELPGLLPVWPPAEDGTQ
jgi:2-haloalkanoic acid dehalogenase type II